MEICVERTICRFSGIITVYPIKKVDGRLATAVPIVLQMRISSFVSVIDWNSLASRGRFDDLILYRVTGTA